MIRKTFILIFILTFLSCGESRPGHGLMSLIIPHAPKITKELNIKYREVVVRLDSIFNGWVKLRAFNGSVLVAQNGEVIYQKCFGLADKEKSIPITDSSAFQLASVSKVITAVAVLKLIEKGLVKLDDTFASYFTDFPYDKVTIKQLLSHRSGLPNYLYFLNDLVSNQAIQLTNEQVLKLMIERKPPVYLQPNRAFNYCNTNYVLLALLIEKVSQKKYSEFLQEEIFDPIGMRNSGTILSLKNGSNLVCKAYDERWKPIDLEAADFVLGDKSVYSTPYDMFLFSEALFQGSLLNSDIQTQAYSALNRDRVSANYGLGWRMKDYKDPQKKEVFHNGWWHGYRTAFHRRLSDKTTIIMFSNQMNKSAYQTFKIYEVIDANGSTLDPHSGEEANE